MTTATRPNVGKLCLGGDWACAHGDFSALRDVARQLAAFAREPLHCALGELADACLHDPERASQRWFEIAKRIRVS